MSLCGRIQLINSVLFSIHTYWISLFIVSKAAIKSIEGVCRRFLWGQTAEYQKGRLWHGKINACPRKGAV